MANLILTPEEIEKIKAEELLRHKIRNELANSEKKSSKLLSFLNSSLGIWFLSSVTLSLISWSYSQWTTTKQSNMQRSEVIRSIDNEMTNRIIDFENNLNKTDNFLNYQYAINNFVGNSGSDGGSSKLFADKEYESIQTRTLLIRLKQLVDNDEKDDIKKAINGVNKLIGLFKNREMTTGEATDNPLSEEIVVEKEKIKDVLESEIIINRWKAE